MIERPIVERPMIERHKNHRHRLRHGLLALVCVAPHVAMAANAPTPATLPALSLSTAPLEAVSALHAFHARLIAGDKDAHAAMANRIAAMAPAFDAAAEHGLYAPMLFALSGGSSRSLRAALASHDKAPDAAAARGVLAFVERRADEARAAFDRLDLSSLPALLAGHIALAMAALTSKKETARAYELFDIARLRAPGGMVEESALRRQAMLAAETGDVARFAIAATRYFSRFGTSVYADGFAASTQGKVIELAMSADDDAMRLLASFLRGLPPQRGSAMALAVARQATLEGRGKAATLAASVAQGAAATPADKQRAQLYGALTSAIERGDNTAAAWLGMPPEQSIDMDERALRAASLALSRDIRQWPRPLAPTKEEKPSPLATRARGALEAADLALALKAPGEP